MSRWAVGLALLAATCGSCVPHRSEFRMMLRPDTRNIDAVVFDSAAYWGSLAIFQRALPNEGAVCYPGIVRDTVLPGDTLRLHVIELQDVIPSREDSASATRVWFAPNSVTAGCERPLGIGHSHPTVVGPESCTHSIPDALLLAGLPTVGVSVVWCVNGIREVLLQDGRRSAVYWRTPKDST